MLKNLESGEQKLYPLQPISNLIKAIQNKELLKIKKADFRL